jgi:hydrogenase maturation protein HypF
MPVIAGRQLDWRPTIREVVRARIGGLAPSAIAAGFHRAMAQGVSSLTCQLLDEHGVDTVVLSGGVFQNSMLVREVSHLLKARAARVWTNERVPCNDGGLSLGQAAIGAMFV